MIRKYEPHETQIWVQFVTALLPNVKLDTWFLNDVKQSLVAAENIAKMVKDKRPNDELEAEVEKANKIWINVQTHAERSPEAAIVQAAACVVLADRLMLEFTVRKR